MQLCYGHFTFPGDISKCPDHVKTDSIRVNGYVNQYDNYCFVLDPQADTWSNAEKHCTQRGGHLLTIRNAQEQEFFTKYLKSYHWVESVYIGLRDDKTEGSYYWSSGNILEFIRFISCFVIILICNMPRILLKNLTLTRL